MKCKLKIKKRTKSKKLHNKRDSEKAIFKKGRVFRMFMCTYRCTVSLSCMEIHILLGECLAFLMEPISSVNISKYSDLLESIGRMLKLKKTLIIIFSFSLIAGCSNVKETTGDEKVISDVKVIADDLENELIHTSSNIFSYLQNEDFEKLAKEVDPVEGIIFSLFADFGAEPGYGGEYVKLSKDDIKNAADKQFVWGYDDSDKEYKMTLKDYVNEMLLSLNGEEVIYKKITFNQSAFEFGGVINMIHENYPNAKYVEYYAPNWNGDNRTFQSIRFIFQERDNVWYLIGISRDVATG